MKPAQQYFSDTIHNLMERKYARFLLPILVLFFAKLIGAVFLYNQMNLGAVDNYWMHVDWNPNGQNTLLLTGYTQGLRWPYLFLGWDGAWYLSIIAKGYAFSNQSFAFFPGLPLLGWLVDSIFQNPFYSLVIVFFLLGIIWIPLFQLVVETYADKTAALLSTVFFAFFPYVFLFTTVAYAEGLFLLFTLSAWLLFRKGKLFLALVVAAGATISRPSGIVIILPMFITAIKNSRESFLKREIFYFSIPVLSFLTWMSYCKITTGDWFAFANRSAWDSLYSLGSVMVKMANGMSINEMIGDLKPPFMHLPFSAIWAVFIILTPILIWKLSKTEKSLAIYSVVYFSAVFIGGAIASIPRFFSFIFPIWMLPTLGLLRKKQSWKLILIICALFYAVGLYFWFSFLNGEFIA